MFYHVVNRVSRQMVDRQMVERQMARRQNAKRQNAGRQIECSRFYTRELGTGAMSDIKLAPSDFTTSNYVTNLFGQFRSTVKCSNYIIKYLIDVANL